MNQPAIQSYELWNYFRSQAASFWHRPALSTPQGELTFAQVFEVAEKLAVMLTRAGVKEGKVIALALPNSLAFVPAFLALLKLSATVALVSSKYRESELQGIIEGIHPSCFLTTDSLAKVFVEKISPQKAFTVSLSELGEDLKLLFPISLPTSRILTADSEMSMRKNAVLIKFTSGSTGIPKGIAVTGDNIKAEAENVATTLNLSPSDRILAPVPVFHSYGFDLAVLSMLYAGAHLAMRESFIPRRIFDDLESRDVTVFLGVPSMYRIFTETLLSTNPDLSHVRYLLSCTAPLPPNLISAFYQKFHMPICQHYGSSETGAVTNHIPGKVLGRLDSVGQPLNNVHIKIMDENGLPVPVGAEGEVVVYSQVVAPGYIMGESTASSKFGEHTYRTGDLGLVDNDGFLYLRGRMDDVINVGGFKVSPYEVTQVLESFAAVREAAVIGVKDALGEEVVYAVVTLKVPATEKEILAFCRSRLSDYKIPRRIDIRDEMPRGPSGKIKLISKDIQL